MQYIFRGYDSILIPERRVRISVNYIAKDIVSMI